VRTRGRKSPFRCWMSVLSSSRAACTGHEAARTQLRWFFKEALRDPAAGSSRKEKHGFGLPVGAWLMGHKPLLDLATRHPFACAGRHPSAGVRR
jgi:hypothetical protein